MSAPKSKNGKDQSNFQILESNIDSKATPLDIAPEPASLNNEQIEPEETGVPQLLPLKTETHKLFYSESAEEKRSELISSKTKLAEKRQETSIFQHLKTKTVASLVGTAVMLPILGVGTATYYFGSQAIDKQAILAKRVDNIGLVETELARQQKLLAALLIGTGTTALLAGMVAAFGTKRFIDSISLKTSTEKTQHESETQLYQEFIQHLNQSVSQEDILQAIVEEAHNYLNCDRVVVYSLNLDQCSVVVAESVASGWTKALNQTISDPYFEAGYLDEYRDGRVRALDNIYEAEITPYYREQLESLEVKANLVTPILNEGKLLGLLVAHQCSESRQWKQAEIEFLNQRAKKVGLALDNVKLLGDLASLQTQAETERKWTNYFTDATQYICKSLKQDDVLEISVEEVRRVLECDRVVVYSLNQDKYGVVIAESVAPGYSRALNKTISDPCFEARYLDKYRDGRVRAINNLQEAELSKCYLEQLESLEVKANLVTPILNEGKLFGLLVAHQCSQPRNWQEHEIRWVTQIATQVGFALDNAKVLVESTTQQAQAEKERKWTNYFTDAIQYIRKSLKQDDVLEISVEEVRRVLECDRVVVYSLNQDQYGVVIAESVAPGYSRALNQTISDPCFEARYLDKYRDGRVRAINNLQEAGLTQCYLEQLESLEVKANLVTPILNEGKLFGLLVAHQCSQPRNWQEYEIRWVTQIATQVGFALDNVELLRRLKNEGVPTQLLKSFTLGIGERLNEAELLKTAVEQARKVMGLDRVIVYQFDANYYGTVVAESVILGYPRALHSKIKDPCFARDYAEKYRQGRIKAISDVHQAGLTDCHLEQLDSFGVKASLVAPILQDNRLFGLLIGHQCSEPHSWEQSEIDLFAQLALQLEFALDRARLREELTQAQLTSRNIANKQQLKQQSFEQQISELLQENKIALQDLKAKINYQSVATSIFLERIEAARDEVKSIATVYPTQLQQHTGHAETIAQNKNKNAQLQKSIAAVQETIAEATEKIENLNQSHHNLYQILSPFNDLKKQINQDNHSSIISIAEIVNPPSHQLAEETVQMESLMGEIIIETNEVAFKPTKNLDFEQNAIAGQIVQGTESAPSLILMNQFVEEIANLSGRISQQTVVVTNSFKKLAAFAKELSINKEED